LLVFLHLMSVLWAQGLQSIGMRLPGKVRAALLVLLVVGLLGGTYWVLGQPLERFLPGGFLPVGASTATAGTRPAPQVDLKALAGQRLMEIRFHPVVAGVLTPLEVFPRIMTARSLGAAALPIGIVLGYCVGLVAVLLRLDADFLDRAEAVGKRRAQLQIAMRRNGGIKIKVTGTAKRKLAMPGYGWGIGPVVWRQINTALRQSRGILITLGALMALVFMLAGNKQARPALYGIGGWGVFLLAGILRFDFRADLDRMTVLKAWPVSAWALAVGQLITPVLLSGAVALAAGVALVAYGVVPVGWALGGAVVGTALIGTIVALENAVFLVFPTRGVGGAGDLQHIGRNALLMAGRLVMLGLGLAAAGGVFALLRYLTKSTVIGFVGGGVVIWAEFLLMVYLVALAFRRFDAGRDTPPT
jgi:hypothetical protein